MFVLLALLFAASHAAAPSVAQRLAAAKTAFRYDVSIVDLATDEKDPLYAEDVSVDHWQLTARGQPKGEHLGFGLTRYHYAAADDADSALKRYLDTADPNTGHDYAWDFAVIDRANADIWLLDAPCLYSAKNFTALTDTLRTLTATQKSDAVHCTCGGGCSSAP